MRKRSVIASLGIMALVLALMATAYKVLMKGEEAAQVRITSYYSPNETRSIAASGDEVWWGTAAGAFRLDIKTGERQLYSQPCNTRAIARDASGIWWFGTNNGIWAFDGAAWKRYTTKDGLANDRVYAIAIDGKGRKWFGARGGVSCFDGKTFKTYAEKDGLAGNWVKAMAVDVEGRMWFGFGFFGEVDNGGVSCFDGKTFKTFTRRDGLADAQVNAIVVDLDGSIWAGTHTGVSHIVLEPKD